MADFVSSLVAFAADHATLAYLLAFVLAACESLPVVGAVVPGTAVIVALSALVPEGVLGLCPLTAATTLGAVAGDGIAYWIGHRYRDTAKDIWPLRRYPGLVDQGVAFFVRHGGKAILIARFTPGVRAVVPLAAGILGMPALWFFAVNVLSAVVWGPTHVAVGVAIGMSLVSLQSTHGRVTAIVGAVFAIVCLVFWVTPHLIRRSSPRRRAAKLQEDTGE
jgi:membrane protein DedA with SNARE-associated domain